MSPASKKSTRKFSNAQPVKITLRMKLDHITTQVFTHFLHSPADFAPVILGNLPQLFPCFLTDFNSVTHHSILPLRVALGKPPNPQSIKAICGRLTPFYSFLRMAHG